MDVLLTDHNLAAGLQAWGQGLQLLRQGSADSSSDVPLSLSVSSTSSATSLTSSSSLHSLLGASAIQHHSGQVPSKSSTPCLLLPGRVTASERVASGASGSSWQAKILKVINSYHNKEDLLRYVSTCVAQLDDINLVTAIYRLARMYSTIRSPSARCIWSAELQADNTFQLLLGAIQSHLLSAQMQLLCKGTFKGLDARGVSNLIWSVIKLELAAKPGCIGHELVHMAAPIVLHILPSSSSQGLANLLWAYSKLPVLMLTIMMAIAAEMATRLENEAGCFDAQALSNSIWALAHVRMSVADMDAAAGANGRGLTVRFLVGIAKCALTTLGTLSTTVDPMRMPAAMHEAERRFSAQALVNICWSFASLLGVECSCIPVIRTLFQCIRAEALIRLQATSSALQLGQAWVITMQGGFNEQALSNIIYAYEKAHLLDRELLQLVYDVATLRLDMTQGLPPAFKPQELCTLLRAAHTNIASPWSFLSKVHTMVANYPRITQPWSSAERAELDRALSLLGVYQTNCLLEQLKNTQHRAMQDQLIALFSGPALMSAAWQ